MPGESGNLKGRPPKLVSSVLKELREAGYARVSSAEVSEMCETMLNAPTEVLRTLEQDKSGPLSVRILAAALLRKKGGFEVLQTVLDRAHGKVKQQVDLTGAGAIPVPTVTVVVQAVNPKP